MHHAELKERKFRTVLSALRAECPTSMNFPVQVRRRHYNPTGLYGYTKVRWYEDAFLIVLFTTIIDPTTNRVRKLTHGETQDTLIHEWAHAMAWTPEHNSVLLHDAAWGVAYARAYQAVVED